MDRLPKHTSSDAEPIKDLPPEEVERHRAETAALLKGCRAVLEYREFEDAARAIFDACRGLIGATAGYVALLSADGSEHEVLFLDSGGLPCTVDPALPMPIRGLRADAYRAGQAAYDNDFAKSEWMQYLPEGHVTLDNVLFAPLNLDGRTVGLIGLANKPGGFTDGDARMGTAFGELAAVALRNSRTLAALEANRAKYRDLVQNANSIILRLDPSGRIILFNEFAQRLFGYTEEEIVGRPLVGTIVPESTGHDLSAMVEEIGQRPQWYAITESECISRDGMQVWVAWTNRAVLDRKGRVQEILCIGNDISPRKQAERELEASVRLHESTLDTMPSSVLVLDRGLNVLMANRRYTELRGVQEAEVVGQRIAAVFPPRLLQEQSLLERIQTVAREGRVKHWECTMCPATMQIGIWTSASVRLLWGKGH